MYCMLFIHLQCFHLKDFCQTGTQCIHHFMVDSTVLVFICMSTFQTFSMWEGHQVAVLYQTCKPNHAYSRIWSKTPLHSFLPLLKVSLNGHMEARYLLQRCSDAWQMVVSPAWLVHCNKTMAHTELAPVERLIHYSYIYLSRIAIRP